MPRTTNHCLLLQHDDAFGPGHVVSSFRDFGIPCRVRRVDREGVPDDLGSDPDVRVLVLLGGRGKVGGSRPDWLEEELAAVKARVEADRPVLAFGFGARVLAAAAGGEVRELEGGEVARYETIKLPFPGGTDPILFGVSDGSPFFFQQNESFDLPKLPPPAGYDPDKPGPPPPTGNALLASATHDKNAAFRFKNSLYGFNFHPELLAEDVKALGGDAAAAGPRSDRLGLRMLQNHVQFFKSYDPPM
jgi:GMP synthase (glutamine-hydrolysing)